MERIYLLLRPSDWEAVRNNPMLYESTLSREGFIHACQWRQLNRVANTYFQGVNELTLLAVNPAKVMPPIRWEESRSTGDVYPHIYGTLNLDAVTQAQTLERGADGRFEIPSIEPALQH